MLSSILRDCPSNENIPYSSRENPLYYLSYNDMDDIVLCVVVSCYRLTHLELSLHGGL